MKMDVQLPIVVELWTGRAKQQGIQMAKAVSRWAN